MPSSTINNNNNNDTTTAVRNFPQGSYRSYRNLLNKYKQNSTKQQDQPQKLVNVLKLNHDQLSKNVQNDVHQLNNQNDDNNNLNIEKLLKMSTNEIELLDKDKLEKFLKILMDKENSSDLNNNNNINDNNNNNNNKNGENVIDDIESCKKNLIQSLKEQLEQYRQRQSY